MIGIALSRQIRPLHAFGWTLCALFIVFSAHAQQSGSIVGRVVDPSGAGLPGAQVSIPALRLRGTTNQRGEFSFGAVPPGEHAMQAEYLGYRSTTQSLTIAAGERAMIDLTLAPTIAAELNSVIVVGTAIRDASARALNQQRTADQLVTVVSSDSIGKFPDPNIAEALQRVSGISIERDQGEGRYVNVRGAPSDFTTVSIDGVTLASPNPTTRAIELDSVPSDIVSQIEITKSLRSDQDADSIAGAINIVTRSPFDSDGFALRTMGGTSYNDYGSTHDSRGSFLISNLFGVNRSVGALLSTSYSKTRRQLDNIESTWTKFTTGSRQIYGVSDHAFKDYDTRRERIAVTSLLDSKLGDRDRVFLRGSYARFEDDEYRNRLNILWADGTLQPGATDTRATFAQTRLEKQFRHRVQRNELTSLSAGAEHERDGFSIDYVLGYSIGEQTYPHRDELLWRSSQRPTLTYDYSINADLPSISLFNSGEHLNVGAYAFRENTFRSNDTEEKELSLASNMTVDSRLAGVAAVWKFGVKFRGKDKTADEERWRDRRGASAPPQPMLAYLSNVRSDNYGYWLGNKFDPSLTRAYLSSAATSGSRSDITRRIPQSLTADYEVQEDVYAGFGQAKLHWGATDLVFGVRIEHTQLDSTALRFNADTSATTVNTASKSYTNFFPSLNVRHAFSDQLIGRAALTRAIARPNFVDTVPRVLEEDTGTLTPRITLGNPNLKPTLSTNIDVALEYYLQPLGIVSAGLFYKDIKNYRYTLTLLGDYAGAPALLTQPQNAPDGSILGAEFNWSQQFERLPGWLSGFGVLANYTYTDADMALGRTYAGRSKFPLQGQSEHTYNLAVFYEKYGLSTRLSYTKRSDYLNEINANDGDFDLYWEGREQLDMTASYRFTRNWEIFAEGKNLTNSAGKRYFGARNRTYEYEKFGYSVFVGLKFDF